ncbi:MAG: gamma-glutamyl-gamma-aminobutyrate hydrolase family protein, partial [bacterium]
GGGVPFIFPYVYEDDELDLLLDRVDGVVLVGGPDLDPRTYGEEPLPTWKKLQDMRQRFDPCFCRKVLERRLPLLAVCLGCQVLNVARGGSLYQDVPTQKPSNIRHNCQLGSNFTRHPVRIAKDSLLHRILGKETIDANSAHHQAVKTLGTGLQATAWAEDGIIEAIEIPDHPFCLGVQWHPEYLSDKEEDHRKLFAAHVEAAATASLAEKR